jgi:hypothetical protein
MPRIVEFLREFQGAFALQVDNPRITVPKLAADLGISEPTAVSVRDALEAEGWLVRERDGRGSVTRMADRLPSRTVRMPGFRHRPVAPLVLLAAAYLNDDPRVRDLWPEILGRLGAGLSAEGPRRLWLPDDPEQWPRLLPFPQGDSGNSIAREEFP